MDQHLTQAIKKAFSLIAFFGLIFFILTLGGSGITTSDIVRTRDLNRSLRIVDMELQDNLQASVYGERKNASIEVRNAFSVIVDQITGFPSAEERVFAENATLKDVKELEYETKYLLKKQKKLRSKVHKANERIARNHDETNWFPWISGLIAVCIGAGTYIWAKLSGFIAF